MNEDIDHLISSRKILEKQLSDVNNRIRDFRNKCEHAFEKKVNSNGTQTHSFIECPKCKLMI